jgi:hypothetical protein
MHYIMWGTSWLNIQMMLADAPRYVRGEVKAKELETEEDIERYMNKYSK